MMGTADLNDPNLAMLEIVVQALGELCESLVFVGGCATGLLVTRVRTQQIRATEDVDVVARVATMAAYRSNRGATCCAWIQARRVTRGADLPMDRRRFHARCHAV